MSYSLKLSNIEQISIILYDYLKIYELKRRSERKCVKLIEDYLLQFENLERLLLISHKINNDCQSIISSYLYDSDPTVNYFSYKRIEYFNTWLVKFQGKDVNITDENYNKISHEMQDLSIITRLNLKPILKKLGLGKLYEHVYHLLNKLNGRLDPVISRELEEKLRIMFKMVQGVYEECLLNRRTFLPYAYIVKKFLELLGHNELNDYFHSIKNIDKLNAQDIIWKRVCTKLQWEFIPSILG